MIKMYRYTHIHICIYIYTRTCVCGRALVHACDACVYACSCTEFSSERAHTKSFSSLELDISLECAAATLRRPDAPLFRD